MRLLKRLGDLGTHPDSEDGSAALEFIVVGVLMLVPLIYLIAALSQIHAQALGVATAARHIARTIAVAATPADAADQAERVLAVAAEEYGLDPGAVRSTLTCTPAGGTCPRAGVIVTVTIRVDVALPLVPDILGFDTIARIPVQGESVQRISRFWEGS